MDKAELRRTRHQVLAYWQTAMRRGEGLCVETLMRSEDLLDTLALAIEALELRERLRTLAGGSSESWVGIAVRSALREARASAVSAAEESRA